MLYSKLSDAEECELIKKVIGEIDDVLVKHGKQFDDSSRFIVGIITNLTHNIIKNISIPGCEELVFNEFMQKIKMGVKLSSNKNIDTDNPH